MKSSLIYGKIKKIPQIDKLNGALINVRTRATKNKKQSKNKLIGMLEELFSKSEFIEKRRYLKKIMDLKGYHCLADLFGKLNSQEKLEDDFTTIPEGGKLKFFWEKCGHEKIDASSIIERTKQKIRRDVMRRRRNYFLVASASVAASILICISTIHFLTHCENTNLDFQAIAEQMDSQSVEEVTLITAKEQLNLDEDAFVTYSKEGKVAVNSKVIREKEEKKVKGEPEYNQLLVPAGKRVRVELSDGTRLVVNSQSKVIYPCRFNGDIRKIYAQGEVFLEVAHDKQHPFIVESEDFKLRVLGTKFNISNYKGGATNIVLVEGSVEVTDRNERKAQLVPSDLLNIANGAIAYQKQVDVAEYISWVDGVMLLNGNDLSHIIQKLSIYYGIPIQCDPMVGKEKVYGKLDLKDDIDEVIECIRQTIPIEVEKSDTSIYLSK